MQHSALHHPLKTGGRFGVLAVLNGQRGEIFVDIFRQSGTEDFQVDIAGTHHLRCVAVIDQRKKQMFQRGVFVMALARQPDGAAQCLFETA